MLQIMKDAVHSELVENEKDFATKIGLNPTNLPKVKTGGVSFTVEQITQACLLTGANANWILGIDKIKIRVAEKEPLAMIRQGLEALEQAGKVKKK
jgi:hypothetical protein